MMKRILPLDSRHYQRHLIHGEDRNWAETNCYVDVWIELLHAMGFEPIAALPFTFAIDFEGDQWTFFKFPLADLQQLYGLDVQELAIWRPLTAHIEEQIARNRHVLVELDSYYLPDTAGTAYQRAHTKSTVAITEIDIVNQRMGYFHNQGYYTLEGADFISIYHIDGPDDPARLPPYVEFVKRTAHTPLRAAELLSKSREMLRRQLRNVPHANPFDAFKHRLQTDLHWIQNESLDFFHQYSFATLRQFGACYELCATYLRWMQLQNETHLEKVIGAFYDLSIAAKALQFQLARAIMRKKPLDMSALDDMAARWSVGMDALHSRYH